MTSQEQQPSPEPSASPQGSPLEKTQPEGLQDGPWNVDGYWDLSLLWDWEEPEEAAPPAAPAPRTPWYRDLLTAPLAILVFFLDQFTKAAVRQALAPGQSIPAEGFLRLTHATNTGMAFGFLPDRTPLLVVASIVGIAVLVIVYRQQRGSRLLLRLALGLQLGGALGNLADRLFLGYVVDFIDVGPWPVFNLADASIVGGIFLLLWVLVGNERGRPDEVERTPATHGL